MEPYPESPKAEAGLCAKEGEKLEERDWAGLVSKDSVSHGAVKTL